MADITVQFGDGSSHIYTGVPDNVTPEQATARAKKDFPKLDIKHLDRKVQNKDEPQEKGYADSVTDANEELKTSLGKGQLERVGKGIVGAGEAALNVAGNIAGPVAGAANVMFGSDPLHPEKAYHEGKEALSYEPKTESGKATSKLLGKITEPVGKVADLPGKAVESIAIATGLPEEHAKFMHEVITDALPFIAGPAGKAAGKAVGPTAKSVGGVALDAGKASMKATKTAIGKIVDKAGKYGIDAEKAFDAIEAAAAIATGGHSLVGTMLVKPYIKRAISSYKADMKVAAADDVIRKAEQETLEKTKAEEATKRQRDTELQAKVQKENEEALKYQKEQEIQKAASEKERKEKFSAQEMQKPKKSIEEIKEELRARNPQSDAKTLTAKSMSDKIKAKLEAVGQKVEEKEPTQEEIEKGYKQAKADAKTFVGGTSDYTKTPSSKLEMLTSRKDVSKQVKDNALRELERRRKLKINVF